MKRTRVRGGLGWCTHPRQLEPRGRVRRHRAHARLLVGLVIQTVHPRLPHGAVVQQRLVRAEVFVQPGPRVRRRPRVRGAVILVVDLHAADQRRAPRSAGKDDGPGWTAEYAAVTAPTAMQSLPSPPLRVPDYYFVIVKRRARGAPLSRRARTRATRSNRRMTERCPCAPSVATYAFGSGAGRLTGPPERGKCPTPAAGNTALGTSPVWCNVDGSYTYSAPQQSAFHRRCDGTTLRCT